MSNVRTILWGLVQALATVLVCGMAIGAIAQLQRWEASADGYLDKLALLLLFVASALVSAAVILTYPSYLALKRQLSAGFLLLLSTTVWLILILAGILLAIVFLHLHTLF